MKEIRTAQDAEETTRSLAASCEEMLADLRKARTAARVQLENLNAVKRRLYKKRCMAKFLEAAQRIARIRDFSFNGPGDLSRPVSVQAREHIGVQETFLAGDMKGEAPFFCSIHDPLLEDLSAPGSIIRELEPGREVEQTAGNIDRYREFADTYEMLRLSFERTASFAEHIKGFLEYCDSFVYLHMKELYDITMMASAELLLTPENPLLRQIFTNKSLIVELLAMPILDEAGLFKPESVDAFNSIASRMAANNPKFFPDPDQEDDRREALAHAAENREETGEEAPPGEPSVLDGLDPDRVTTPGEALEVNAILVDEFERIMGVLEGLRNETMAGLESLVATRRHLCRQGCLARFVAAASELEGIDEVWPDHRLRELGGELEKPLGHQLETIVALREDCLAGKVPSEAAHFAQSFNGPLHPSDVLFPMKEGSEVANCRTNIATVRRIAAKAVELTENFRAITSLAGYMDHLLVSLNGLCTDLSGDLARVAASKHQYASLSDEEKNIVSRAFVLKAFVADIIFTGIVDEAGNFLDESVDTINWYVDRLLELYPELSAEEEE